ncbi:MAG TPA: SIS domain-containing protein [Trebonia sp.]|jgi:D-sedoheptulose 7-phosphate isomerase
MASTVTATDVTRLFELRNAPARELGGQAAAVADACHAMAVRFHHGGRLVTFGTGGASADAQHVAVEFVHPVIIGKRALPAFSLTTDVATVTGIAERDGVADIFSRQIRCVARPGDIALGISRGWDSPSVLAGLEAASELGMLTIALTGAPGAMGGAAGDASAAGADGAGSAGSAHEEHGEDAAIPGSPAVDHVLVAASGDRQVVKETHVTMYHVLWELVHVFFEQPGVLA